MKSLSSSSVQLVTVPVVPYVGNPAAELSWAQPQSARMFRAIQADRNLPAATKARGKSKSKSKSKSKGQGKSATVAPTVSPARVQVQVLNGSGVTGVAGTTASALTAKGFTVTGTGPAANYGYSSSVIQYSSAAQLPEVHTLKALVGPVVVQQDTALGTGSLNLILGSSFNGLGTAKSTGGKPSAKSLGNLAKSYGGITASTNICKDSAAFAGPDNPLPGG
jgi:hypothetical protein